ncbi:MAG TPA: hypothetical protein VNC50_02005, partial [Planctomycetia bacterium]|nr:hypothetical protein [Planctomycetia bacterium]
DLDAGRIAEAKKRLEATDKNLRSFEFEYARARAKAATEGKAAPDLVHSLTSPGVETRYGALNVETRKLAFICRDGGVRVYDLAAPAAEPKTAMHAEGGAIWSGAFSLDGRTFVAGHESGEAVVWDAADWKIRHTVTLSEKWPVREIAIAPDGSAIVAESKTALELWSLAGEKPKKIAEVGPRYNFGEGLAFSPAGDLIATGGMFDINLHDAKTGAPTGKMRHASYTMGLEFSPDGKRIASAPRGNVNKFLSVFDVADAKSLFVAGPFPQYVAGMAFTSDGKRVVATGPDMSVRLFDAATGEVMLNLKRAEHTAKPGVAANGRLIGWSEQSGFKYIDLDAKPPARIKGLIVP